MPDLSRRRLTALGAAAGLTALATRGARAAAAAAAPADLSFVDPDLRPAARQLLQGLGAAPPLSPESLPAMRAMMSRPFRPELSAPAYQKRRITGPAGAPDVSVYVINARPGPPRPAILHTHGGGFVMGAAASDLGDLQETAAALDCVIVSVDYRLAPETSYAGSIEDNYAGLRWLHGHAAELGADPHRIAVMGESAGGGHAALLALVARDRGEIPLVLQVLTYPMLDDRTGVTHTPPRPIGSILWTAEQNRFGWRAFLGQAPGGPDVPVHAVPARHGDLKGVAPAFIGVGAVDLFVDEDVDYARRLIDVGVPTELTVIPGAFHGFDGVAPQAPVSRGFKAARLNALRRAFADPAPATA